jgi:hypothetical protein
MELLKGPGRFDVKNLPKFEKALDAVELREELDLSTAILKL